jgi:hypothetical protein
VHTPKYLYLSPIPLCGIAEIRVRKGLRMFNWGIPIEIRILAGIVVVVLIIIWAIRKKRRDS